MISRKNMKYIKFYSSKVAFLNFLLANKREFAAYTRKQGN